MAKNKDRAWFICPNWSEVAKNLPVAALRGHPAGTVHAKALTAIKAGTPVPHSTLRKALLAVQRAGGGAPFDVDAHIVDRRRG